MNRFSHPKQWCLFLLLSCFVASCATTSDDENTPEGLYKQAEQDIDNDHYLLAIEKLRKVKNKFPYSSYSGKAQARLGDVYFLQESFAEAAESYRSYVELYPSGDRTSYARFRIGEAYQKDMPSNIARDQSSGYEAQTALKDYLSRYSGTEEAKKAKQLLEEVEGQLAEKELYIAKFYFREEQWKATEQRCKKILSLYPDTEAAAKARKLMSKLKEQPGYGT